MLDEPTSGRILSHLGEPTRRIDGLAAPWVNHGTWSGSGPGTWRFCRRSARMAQHRSGGRNDCVLSFSVLRQVPGEGQPHLWTAPGWWCGIIAAIVPPAATRPAEMAGPAVGTEVGSGNCLARLELQVEAETVRMGLVG